MEPRVEEFRRTLYEPDDAFSADAYRVDGWDGIAFRVLGWELDSDEDTEWTGTYERTGQVAVHMVGDDRVFLVDPDDLTPLRDGEYCPECGQIPACWPWSQLSKETEDDVRE